MPKIVDHNQRRMAVAKVVEDIVYEAGIEALTIREVARRVGCSPSVLAHYFDDKLDMLVFTARQVQQRAENALLQALASGLNAENSFQLMLPADEARWRDWHTWFAFWGMAPSFDVLQNEWNATTSAANQIFLRLIRQAQVDGQINPARDPHAIPTDTQIIINGIATLVAQARDEWPAARQIERFKAMFALITA